MTTPSARERLATAAFELFVERGYEETTVDDIAERAQLGRTTFFRCYKSKEEVIFPNHDQLLSAISARLRTSTEQTSLVAVTEAVRLVLMRYIDEGERARQRYLLTNRVPALRDREIASVARYQRLFREFLASWITPSPTASLRAEVMSAAIVSAHNHVLRRWLRQETEAPLREIDVAMKEVIALFNPFSSDSGDNGDNGDNGDTTVVVFRSTRSIEDVVESLRGLE